MFLYYQLKNMKIFSHNHHSFLAIKKKKIRHTQTLLLVKIKLDLFESKPNFLIHNSN